MLSQATRFQILAVLAFLSSAAAAAQFSPRGGDLTLPSIFRNGTAQVTSLTEKLNSAIVFNSSVKTDPQEVTYILDLIGAVVTGTSDQLKQIADAPFDQISGGLEQNDIVYISNQFLTAATLSLTAPQSIAAKYPEIQKGIDGVQACIIPLGPWLCIFFPWLCCFGPWLLTAASVFERVASAITP
ncbi:hypothetical protein FRB90_008079 [Tulasnella sp. 427]|nr:hypothetical protein FRB90_008079 [Tulasnella sp. 427]